MTEELTLLPCPFCGHRADLTRYYEFNAFAAYCGYCGVMTGLRDTRKEAAAIWNSRVPKEDNSAH